MVSNATENIDPEMRVSMLETIMRIREFESEAEVRFADNEMPGFVHLYHGQEAIAAGVCQALEINDYISSTHRGHGHCIAKGMDPERMMAELYGKKTGYSRGKGGSMHMADAETGVLGTNGIVGGGIPIAAGAALSSQMRQSEAVTVSFFGDGAISEGAFHEAMNMAGLWDLPLIGVIENNQFAEMTPLDDHHPAESLDDLTVYGEPYGAHREQVDGMDPDSVYEAALGAVERARDGEGPTLLECVAYRYKGHHEGDEEGYRTDEDIEEWRERDPIRTYPKRLIDDGVVTEEEVENLRAEAQAEMQDAVEFARDSPLPEPKAAYESTLQGGR